MTLREKALGFASKKHEGQTRIDGSPYIFHPIRVAMIVEKFKLSHEMDSLIAAAFLHDVVEDTQTSLEEITKEFGVLVSSLVEELTSNKAIIRARGKANYLLDKMVKMSNWGLVLKLADRADNVKDLIHASKEFEEKYKKETIFILDKLEVNRALTNTQKVLVDKIRELI